eukprot:gb/GECG01001076.1/.p1 GENE.gb/GECG01001076.1/~~gb/GECG01001076.1/.p1  ORF type:complete len:685 (+),score=63.49 gb/GECG01001076.1/:1-2055(+)
MIRRKLGRPGLLPIVLLLYGLGLQFGVCTHMGGYTGDADVGINLDAFKTMNSGMEGWREIDMSGGPSARRWHVAATWRQRFMLIHGGCDARESSASDLFMLDGAQMKWYKLKTEGDIPSRRCRHCGAIDEVYDNFFVFGGQKHPDGPSYSDAYLLDLKPLLNNESHAFCSSSGNDVNETKLDIATLRWRKIDHVGEEAPDGKHGLSCVLHDNLAVLLGGTPGSNPMWQAAINSSAATARWKLSDGDESPSPFQGQALLLASKDVLEKGSIGSNIISSAKHQRSLQPEVRECSSWPELSLVSFGGISPSMTFVNDRIEKFVVNSRNPESGFIAGEWKRVHVQGLDVERSYMGATISDYSLVVFGGFSRATDRFGRELGLAFSDLLIFVGDRAGLQNVWYKLDGADSSSTPDARFGQSLVCLNIPGRPRLGVVFGGYFDSPFGDAWQIELQDLSVSQVEQSDLDPPEVGFPFINATTFLGGLLASVCVFAIIFGITVRRWSRTNQLASLFHPNTGGTGEEDGTIPAELLNEIPTTVYSKDNPPSSTGGETQPMQQPRRPSSSGSVAPEEATQSVNHVSWHQDTCTICYVEFEDQEELAALPCEHVFHMDCIKEWLRRKPNCPLCKADTLTQLREQRRDDSQQRPGSQGDTNHIEVEVRASSSSTTASSTSVTTTTSSTAAYTPAVL